MNIHPLKYNATNLGKLPLFRVAVLAISSIFASMVSSQGQVIVSDDFEKAAESQNTSTIESKTFWETSDNRSLLGTVTDPTGLNSGKVLSVGNGLAFARIPETALEVGSSIVFSMRFRSRDEEILYPAPLRIGICENKDDSPDKGDTAGYWLSTGPGADRKSSISLELNSDSAIGGGNDGVGIGGAFVPGYDWLKPHRLVIKVMRPTEAAIEIHLQFDDDAEIVRTDSKSSVTKFNLIAMRVANTPKSCVLFDDIKVELVKTPK
ncbi:MAG: hypothetical protein ABIT76_09630 [Chthoniobacterales bacterium]